MVVNIQQINPSSPTRPRFPNRSGFGPRMNYTGQDVNHKPTSLPRKSRDERHLYTIQMLNRDEVTSLHSIEVDAKLS